MSGSSYASEPGSGTPTPSEPTGAPTAPPPLGRDRFFASASPDLSLVAEWTAHVDRWLRGLFEAALAGGPAAGLALVAVGGYGRGELCPASDLDVLLLHDGRRDVAEIAERLWYPVWDEGEKLGHAVRTTREALALAADDLDTATSLLEVRALAGDPQLADGLATGAVAAWEKRGRRWLRRLADSVEARHHQAAEVAFHLEPDLKAGRGGLRDVHALRWASRARQVLLDDDLATLDAAYARLLAARVALHLQTGRASDVLTLQEQDGVAAALGTDADALMADLAAAGRSIAWRADETWYRGPVVAGRPGLGLHPHRPRRRRRAGAPRSRGAPAPGRRSGHGPDARPARRGRGREPGHADRPRVARSPRRAGGRDARSLARRCARRVRRAAVGRSAGHRGDRGARPARPVGAHPARVGAGAVAAAAQRLPPLHRRPAPVRGGGQRRRPDRSGVPPRPARAGRAAARHRQGAARRPHRGRAWTSSPASGRASGCPPRTSTCSSRWSATTCCCPTWPPAATSTTPPRSTRWPARSATARTLELLDALTEADSLATGPAAWGTWKAGLVAELVDRTMVQLGGDGPPTPIGRRRSRPPSTERCWPRARW